MIYPDTKEALIEAIQAAKKAGTLVCRFSPSQLKRFDVHKLKYLYSDNGITPDRFKPILKNTEEKPC